MIKRSIVNKYNKPLVIIVNTIGIITSTLSLTGNISSEIRSNAYFKIAVVLMLIFGGTLLFRFIRELLKSRSKSVKFIWYSFTVSFFAFFIVSTILQRPRNSSTETILVNSKNIINEQTQNSDISKVEVNSNSAKNIHVISGNGNVVGVNGNVTYQTNKPVSRKLNRNDVKLILSSIPSKDFLVRVGYPANNQEAINFSTQIFDTLFKLGYTNISKGDVSKSQNYFGAERITVKKDSLPVQGIRLIINPQQ